jgi:methionyl-tRNA formyltransferase
MKAVFMGKNKRSAAGALRHLAETGWDVAAVLAQEPGELTHPDQRLDAVAGEHGLHLMSEDELYSAAGDLGDVDLLVSFLFWNRIREPLISLPRLALNFHPAPLPDMRGVGGYNVAILEGFEEWGASAHVIEETFDTGDLVRVDRFPIDPAAETAYSLDLRTQERLLEGFRDVTDRLRRGEELERAPQGEGRYVSREDFEELRTVRPGDDLERKLRAFWYPPHPGAAIELEGRTLTLVDERLLAEAARAYRDAGRVP